KIVAAPAPTPVVDEPSGPIITIEPEPTEPLPIPVPVKKRKAQLPDPPELAARAGEVAVAHRHGQSGAMEAMPAVLIDLSALEAPVEPVQVDRSGEISRPFVEPPRNAIPPAVLVEVSDDIASVVTPIEDAASAPILLSPAMAKSHPGIVISSIEGEASEPIELIAKVRERARIARQTQLGFAPPPSSTNGRPDRDTEVNALTRDTEITTAVMFDEDGMPLSDDALVQVAPPGPATTPSVIVDETIVAAPVVFAPAVSAPVVMGAHDDDPNEHSIPTAIETPRDATLPFAIKMVPPAPITPALDPVDDGWGPPGTTIPPPFVGEAHDLDQTASVIPIPTQDSAPLPIAARESSGTPSMWRGSASADAARALEASTAETFRLLTVLDRAASRDEVIGALVEHLAKSHRDAAFCVVRNLDVAVFAKRPGMVPTPPPTLSLSESSALQDAYSTRIPYRGVVPDARTGAFMQSIFSRIPSDLLLLPIIIRERTIGIWCGTERDRAAFDEQLALVARAAGTALERIVRSKSK
ncbi:MAG TPA: hypothetical protein PLF40_23215, partial [Kofleriaceae bacterium]|nr:hypothetical protein [Kofleriaceae bacterium]